MRLTRQWKVRGRRSHRGPASLLLILGQKPPADDKRNPEHRKTECRSSPAVIVEHPVDDHHENEQQDKPRNGSCLRRVVNSEPPPVIEHAAKIVDTQWARTIAARTAASGWFLSLTRRAARSCRLAPNSRDKIGQTSRCLYAHHLILLWP
jgi:hypothetical protein